MTILRWLDANLEKYVCVTLFMLISAIMIVNVFMRFVLNNAIPWASDLVLFIFVWFIWFAISYGLKEGAHVNVTVVVNLLPVKVQAFLALFCNLLILAGFAVLLEVSVQLLTHRSVVGKTGLLIKYPMWSLYLASPIGLALSLFRLAQNTLRLLRRNGAGTQPEGGTA
jgi:TRAP-type C4-dicarboxylate transport system, small permease component